MFPKQAANSLVTETLQYFISFCRSGYFAIPAKCLIINDLRFILTILFFTAFLNITHSARHTYATTICLMNGVSLETLSKMLGHKRITTTQTYAKVTQPMIDREVEMLKEKLADKFMAV